MMAPNKLPRKHHDKQQSDARRPFSNFKWALLLATTLLTLSCASGGNQRGAIAPTRGATRVFVEALLTATEAGDLNQWAGKSIEEVGAIVVLQPRSLSSSHVVATSGQRAMVNLPPRGKDYEPQELVQYEVLPEADNERNRLVLHFTIQFGNGELKKATTIAFPDRLAIIPLENGMTLVAHAEIISSEEDLQRIYERKVQAANAEH